MAGNGFIGLRAAQYFAKDPLKCTERRQIHDPVVTVADDLGKPAKQIDRGRAMAQENTHKLFSADHRDERLAQSRDRSRAPLTINCGKITELIATPEGRELIFSA